MIRRLRLRYLRWQLRQLYAVSDRPTCWHHEERDLLRRIAQLTDNTRD